MTAELYRDVPDAIVGWRGQGIKSYIYSSGSREAQRLFFGHTQVCVCVGGETGGGGGRAGGRWERGGADEVGGSWHYNR